ncbi:unnamed protein product [Rotaria socialis]|uniref:J domain-containing protein n=1 Tax=Rotaria socialis TaxID=392032 RepID=A0A817UZB6_9BILA|nr:unnamed protein product [Rotaria socialis]CAF3334775.1 unnamed protein product [Rotaria socialis]CAF3435706.1 unnamed protein product [Rotaria socialis]CAF3446063.1 unnamed protein product [Rotaria socialis]CAF3522217.1 unnamed protein product [Rotaria socialis]
MLRTSQKYLTINKGCCDRFHPYGNIIQSTIQLPRSIVVIPCRYYKTPNFNSRNYYEVLGVEPAATQKEIKKAFYKLSKEYHPDSNAADKSLHDKFVKINEAFSILNKQSARNTYDQSLSTISRSPYQSYPRYSGTDWSNVNSNTRYTYQRRTTTNEFTWGTPRYDQAYYDAFRRKMESDRRRSQNYSYYYSSSYNSSGGYFTSASIILIVISFGMFIHALQWRTMRYSDPQYAVDPRTRHYHAYREWRRMHTLKNNEFTQDPRESSSSSIDEN